MRTMTVLNLGRFTDGHIIFIFVFFTDLPKTLVGITEGI